ncbi:cardiolipin synthase, partial [Candidatus Poribacteria bacterium]|nr:cardiolipin synthase [Candidatus Poribacteria bacterium]
FWEPMLEAGVRIYQYQPVMMHAMMILADHRLASVGSANLDVRSLALNFELNLVFYSKFELRRVERLFETAFEQSSEVGTAFRARRAPVRVVENCCRLFSPVL